MKANLARNLITTARRCPARTAVKLDDDALTYAALDDASARAARFVRALGVRTKDRVGLLLPGVLELPVLYYGALRAGAVVVPLSIRLGGGEIGHQLIDSASRLLIAWSGFADAARTGAAEADANCVLLDVGELAAILARLAPMAEPTVRDAADAAVVVPAASATGAPRVIELAHGALAQDVETARLLFGIDEQSVVLCALPPSSTFGQECGLNATVRAGALLTLIPRFEAGKALQVIERDRVTLFHGAPTMLTGLLRHPDRERFDLSSLRLCVSIGAALPAALRRECEGALGCAIVEARGVADPLT